jgi:hypothetical protein
MSAEQARALATHVRHVGMNVADAIGQANSDRLPVPLEVYSVQSTLLAWARLLERRADEQADGGQP